MRPTRGAVRMVVVVAAVCGWVASGPPAHAQDQDFNGLWWNRYNAFQPSPDVAPGLWWDHYQPPARPIWNGPYYTVDHWDPYIPRTVAWSPLIYSFSNYPPQSTRPSAFYAPFSPGPQTYPANQTVFWQYVWPALSPETQALLGDQLGLGSGTTEPAPALPVIPRRGLKQYYRKHVLGPLKGTYWEEHEAPVYEMPPGPRVIRGDHFGFTQYYRPAGQNRWALKSSRTPRRVIEPQKAQQAKPKDEK